MAKKKKKPMMNKIAKLKRQDQYLIHEGQNAPQSLTVKVAILKVWCWMLPP